MLALLIEIDNARVERSALQDEYVLRVIVESENGTTATKMLNRFKKLNDGEVSVKCSQSQ